MEENFGIFSEGILKNYTSNWTEVNTRSFTEGESKAIAKAVVQNSKYGKSVCFMLVNGNKSFIPLEVNTSCLVNDELKPENMALVHLRYIGTDPSVTKKDVLRVRVNVPAQEPTFDNPFGI